MSIIESLERTRFFFGRLLTSEDFEREQAYLLGRSRRHNRFLHGWGIVTGLEVRLVGHGSLEVSPGMAIDCVGNEIVIESPTCVQIRTATARLYLALGYKEVEVGSIPIANAGTEPGLIRESFELSLLDANPALGHRHMGPGTPGCGQSHPLCLAALTKTPKGWKLLRVKSGI